MIALPVVLSLIVAGRVEAKDDSGGTISVDSGDTSVGLAHSLRLKGRVVADERQHPGKKKAQSVAPVIDGRKVLYIDRADVLIYASSGDDKRLCDFIWFKFLDLEGWLSRHPEAGVIANKLRNIDNEQPTLTTYTKFGWATHRDDDELVKALNPGIVGRFLILYNGDVLRDERGKPVD